MLDGALADQRYTSVPPGVCVPPFSAVQVYDMAQQEMEYRVGLFNA